MLFPSPYSLCMTPLPGHTNWFLNLGRCCCCCSCFYHPAPLLPPPVHDSPLPLRAHELVLKLKPLLLQLGLLAHSPTGWAGLADRAGLADGSEQEGQVPVPPNLQRKVRGNRLAGSFWSPTHGTPCGCPRLRSDIFVAGTPMDVGRLLRRSEQVAAHHARNEWAPTALIAVGGPSHSNGWWPSLLVTGGGKPATCKRVLFVQTLYLSTRPVCAFVR